MNNISRTGEKHTKNLSIFQGAVRLYKKRGLKFLIYNITLILASDYIKFLNKKSIQASHDEYLLKEILGSKMYLSRTTDGLSFDLIMDGIRENYIVESWQKKIKKDDIVVDIGANIGYYALLEAKIVGEKGKVYAIEPVPDNVDLLKRNIELNKYTNIEVYQLAIGSKDGLAPCYIAKARNLSTLIKQISHAEKGGYVKEIEVKLTTIDDFLKDKPYPNKIRMDVEGYEYEIIKGMNETLEACLPLEIFIEFHFDLLGKEKSLEILRILKEADFEISDITNEQRLVGARQHRFLANIVSFLSRKCGVPPYGHLSLSINDVMSNVTILEGNWWNLEICFKRSQRYS